MASSGLYRLYSFVANGYLSPLQCGLQTAHVVSKMSTQCDGSTAKQAVFSDWARHDHTIIICGAFNHQGVIDCFNEIKRTSSALGLPATIFYEDEQSMNGMATACGVVVPVEYYDVTFEGAFERGSPHDRYVHSVKTVDGQVTSLREYPLTHPEGQFIHHIKQYRLA